MERIQSNVPVFSFSSSYVAEHLEAFQNMWICTEPLQVDQGDELKLLFACGLDDTRNEHLEVFLKELHFPV